MENPVARYDATVVIMMIGGCLTRGPMDMQLTLGGRADMYMEGSHGGGDTWGEQDSLGLWRAHLVITQHSTTNKEPSVLVFPSIVVVV